MEEQRLPGVSEKKHGKLTLIIVAVFLVVAVIVAVATALWPGKERAAPPGYTAEEPFDPYAGYYLSPETLETVSLEAVREFMPTAASLTALDPQGVYAGNYGVMDANGAELGLVVLDNSGGISSERIYGVGLETAKGLAVRIIADEGIDPGLLLLEYAYINHASEHVTEYHFIYRPHIGGVPVFNQDCCSIWLNPLDGSIMFFSLNGSFVLPDITPTETRISREEAISLAVEEFSKVVYEEEYPVSDAQEPSAGVRYVLAKPATFVYSQAEGRITPCWEIPLARYFTTIDDEGNAIDMNTIGGRFYEVNATTGEVVLSALW